MVVPAFVGRRDEVQRLGQVLRGEPDAAPVAVVTGDAGIGKTRLLAEVLRAHPEVLGLAGGCLPMPSRRFATTPARAAMRGLRCPWAITQSPRTSARLADRTTVRTLRTTCCASARTTTLCSTLVASTSTASC